jgi:asparagine synthase (glutamine-hydrolysing)
MCGLAVRLGLGGRLADTAVLTRKAQSVWPLASGLHARETNWQVSADFLLHGQLDETPATFYAGIEQVPAGSAFELRLDGGWRQWTYWSLAPIEPEPMTDVNATFAELFEDAVGIGLGATFP